MINNQEIEQNINDQVKACIHCGMCLSACPTYLITGNEGNSPRGRIYLINDLIKKEEIDKTELATTTEYLDNCLSCYACETVCPSNVDYSGILNHARQNYSVSNYSKGFMGLIRFLSFKFLLPNRNLLYLFGNLLRNFSWLMTACSIFSKKIKLLSNLKSSLNKEYRKIQTNHIYHSDIYLKNINLETRIVSLPLGCVMDTLFNVVHWDTIYVLNKFGYHVYIPNTGCCGSLASHSGEYELGKQQVQEVLLQFAQNKYPVVMNSAGCGAFVKEHNHENFPIIDLITALRSSPYNPIQECHSYINQKLKISYHPACHLNHKQGVAYEYLDLLREIPSLEINIIKSADVCCGSAGFYNLIKPEMANAIGQEKVKNIQKSDAKILVTANPGCISQIQSLLPDDYTVVHPVNLIADYLRTS